MLVPAPTRTKPKLPRALVHGHEKAVEELDGLLAKIEGMGVLFNRILAKFRVHLQELVSQGATEKFAELFQRINADSNVRRGVQEYDQITQNQQEAIVGLNDKLSGLRARVDKDLDQVKEVAESLVEMQNPADQGAIEGFQDALTRLDVAVQEVNSQPIL